jgi:hypothetical protein
LVLLDAVFRLYLCGEIFYRTTIWLFGCLGHETSASSDNQEHKSTTETLRHGENFWDRRTNQEQHQSQDGERPEGPAKKNKNAHKFSAQENKNRLLAMQMA